MLKKYLEEALQQEELVAVVNKYLKDFIILWINNNIKDAIRKLSQEQLQNIAKYFVPNKDIKLYRGITDINIQKFLQKNNIDGLRINDILSLESDGYTSWTHSIDIANKIASKDINLVFKIVAKLQDIFIDFTMIPDLDKITLYAHEEEAILKPGKYDCKIVAIKFNNIKLNKISKDISKIENAVIKANNARAIYNFALDIKGANILKLEDAIIKTSNAEYIYNFALDIRDANISRLEDTIIKTNDAYYIYYFARFVKGANISSLEDIIIKTNDAGYIYAFAHDVKDANILKLEDAIIKTNSAKYIYDFALNVKNANKERLMQRYNELKN